MLFIIILSVVVAIPVLAVKDINALARGFQLSGVGQIRFIVYGCIWWSGIMMAFVLPMQIFQDWIGPRKFRIDWNRLSVEARRLTWRDCLRPGIIWAAMKRARTVKESTANSKPGET